MLINLPFGQGSVGTLYSIYFEMVQPDGKERIHFQDGSGEFLDAQLIYVAGRLILAVSW